MLQHPKVEESRSAGKFTQISSLIPKQLSNTFIENSITFCLVKQANLTHRKSENQLERFEIGNSSSDSSQR